MARTGVDLHAGSRRIEADFIGERALHAGGIIRSGGKVIGDARDQTGNGVDVTFPTAMLLVYWPVSPIINAIAGDAGVRAGIPYQGHAGRAGPPASKTKTNSATLANNRLNPSPA